MDTTATINTGSGAIASSSNNSIKFVSLGMVVLDELRVPGGRMATPVCPSSIGCFVLAGVDFPDSVVQGCLGVWGVTRYQQGPVQTLHPGSSRVSGGQFPG